MTAHPSVIERLRRLSPDQHAAATAPPGPVLCVAPAGSGKTTTLVARVAWRIDGGTPPDRICVLTFNRRAADELRERLGEALAPLGIGPAAVRIRTFHALGREVLAEAGEPVDRLLDRAALLAELAGHPLPAAALRRLDDAFSRLKLDAGVDAEAVERQLEADRTTGTPPSPTLEAFVRYERALHTRGALDFDDLVRRALDRLEDDAGLLARWRERCAAVFVDETQDVDRAQLRLALLLAEPGRDVFLVGDDDQTIYAWRLADVRRILGLAAALPGLRRVDLVVNRRCPAPVVARASRLVEHNEERFAKRILSRPGAGGELVLAPDPADDPARARRLLTAWAPALHAPDASTHAVLARTNVELAPYAAAALELGLQYRAEIDGLDLLDDPAVDRVLAQAEAGTEPPVVALWQLRRTSTRAERAVLGVLGRLERELASDPAPGARRWAQAGPVMGTLVADLMGAQALELEATLRRVHSLEDGVDAHRARIAGKRLRYLLEPFTAARRSGVIERLQRFQDALGEWQDARVLLTRIGSERAKVERRRRAGGSRDPRIGLDALATRARERLARAFTAFDREWLRGRGVQRIFTALRSFSKSAAPGVSPRELRS